MTMINVSIRSDLIDIVSFIDREFNSDNLSYQLDSFDFTITIFEKYNLLLRITIRMGEYTVYNDFSDYHGYDFDDEEYVNFKDEIENLNKDFNLKSKNPLPYVGVHPTWIKLL